MSSLAHGPAGVCSWRLIKDIKEKLRCQLLIAGWYVLIKDQTIVWEQVVSYCLLRFKKFASAAIINAMASLFKKWIGEL
jgi:hypothetical protein